MLRGRANRLLSGAHSPRTSWRAGLAESWNILVRRPSPLSPPRAFRAACRADHFPGFLSMSLDRSEHQRLRNAAGEQGATVNALPLRDLFLALDDWNQTQGHRRARPLRTMMPTDLRESEDCEMPAANLTSYAFLNRNAHTWGSPDELLVSIRNETELFKSRRSGMKFMHIIDRASRIKMAAAIHPFAQYLSGNRRLVKRRRSEPAVHGQISPPIGSHCVWQLSARCDHWRPAAASEDAGLVFHLAIQPPADRQPALRSSLFPLGRYGDAYRRLRAAASSIGWLRRLQATIVWFDSWQCLFSAGF